MNFTDEEKIVFAIFDKKFDPFRPDVFRLPVIANHAVSKKRNLFLKLPKSIQEKIPNAFKKRLKLEEEEKENFYYHKGQALGLLAEKDPLLKKCLKNKKFTLEDALYHYIVTKTEIEKGTLE